MIEMQELQGLGIADIVTILKEEEDQPFDIYIPKQTQQFFSANSDIALDYARLAYAGQKLSIIAQSFEYDEVTPSAHESVLFTVGVTNVEQLAEVLLELSYGYVNDSEDEEFDFDMEVEGFLDEVEKGKIHPACPYFVEIYNEYLV